MFALLIAACIFVGILLYMVMGVVVAGLSVRTGLCNDPETNENADGYLAVGFLWPVSWVVVLFAWIWTLQPVSAVVDHLFKRLKGRRKPEAKPEAKPDLPKARVV